VFVRHAKANRRVRRSSVGPSLVERKPSADLCDLWILFGSAVRRGAPDAPGVPVWDASVAAL
jgi:hypothetical protein